MPEARSTAREQKGDAEGHNTHQETVAVHAAHDRLAFEDPLGVLLVEREQHTGGVAQLVQGELHAPELALVTETVLANRLQLIVETLLLERTTRLLEGLGVCGGRAGGEAGGQRRGRRERRRKKRRCRDAARRARVHSRQPGRDDIGVAPGTEARESDRCDAAAELARRRLGLSRAASSPRAAARSTASR